MARDSWSDPLTKYRFQIYIDGIDLVGGFKSVSGLDVKVGAIPYRLSGRQTARLSARSRPGLVALPTITLSRGAMRGESLSTWMEQVAPGFGDYPNRLTDIRSDVEIQLRDKRRYTGYPHPTLAWVLEEAYPVTYDLLGGGLDSMSSEILFQSITLAGEHLRITARDSDE